MADNIKGIPFSSSDEGVDYQLKAKILVVQDREKAGDALVTVDDVYVVWFAKALENWKACLSTTVPDGMYYEITYNGAKKEAYVDAYVKVRNTAVPD